MSYLLKKTQKMAELHIKHAITKDEMYLEENVHPELTEKLQEHFDSKSASPADKEERK